MADPSSSDDLSTIIVVVVASATQIGFNVESTLMAFQQKIISKVLSNATKYCPALFVETTTTRVDYGSSVKSLLGRETALAVKFMTPGSSMADTLK